MARSIPSAVLIPILALSILQQCVLSLADDLVGGLEQRPHELLNDKTTDIQNRVEFTPARQFVHSRVEEDGYLFSTEVNISGYRESAVQIAIWSKENVFLGEKRVVPPYEDTHWKSLKIFVPYSRLSDVAPPFGYSVYAVPLNEPDKYVARADFPSSNLSLPKIIWTQYGYRNDVSVGRLKEPGFVAKVSFIVSGFKDTPIKVMSVVRSRYYGNQAGNYSKPLIIGSTTTTPGHESTVYDAFDMAVPYSALASFSPAEAMTMTPALEIGEVPYEGNVHFHFLAGGSLDRVEQITRDDINKRTQLIDDLRRRVKLLQPQN